MSIIRTGLLALATLVAILSAPQTAAAWGETGHRVVGQVAYQLLSPKAQAAVDQILASDAERTKPGKQCALATLGDAGQWPDCMRSKTWDKTYGSNHFDNIPFCRKMPPGGYCKGGCATARIEKSIKLLKDPKATANQKAEALGWLTHLIGDVHQPLHVLDDVGGNGVWVNTLDPQGSRRIKIHSYWDTFSVEHDDLIPAAATSTRITPAFVETRTLQVAKAQQAAWGGGDFKAWMAEGHQLATTFAYTQLAPASACELPHGDDADATDVTTTYQQATQAMVRDQLAKAAVRLAAQLDTIFA